jgi:Putative Ig domain/Domain of unknown function DUF11
VKKIRPRLLRTLPLAGALALTATVVPALASPALAAPESSLPTGCTAGASTVTCTYTAGGQTQFTVPQGVTSIAATVVGAHGATDFDDEGPGGLGAVATGTLTVSSGENLYLEVNVLGGSTSFGGGAGGGESDVRTSPSSADRLLVAGGGGGNGWWALGGGNAGIPSPGANGSDTSIGPGQPQSGPGLGATLTGPGAAGAGCDGDNSGSAGGTNGAGGSGGSPGDTTLNVSGGGGGAGWFGGGGGGASGDCFATSGGGGGSSYAAPSLTGASFAQATSGEAASVTLTFATPPPIAPLAVTTTSLPAVTAGTAYSQLLSASGGVTPYTWSLASGALPAGVTLSAGGTLSGTPSAPGGYTFTVQAADSESPAVTATGQLTLTVNPAAVAPLAVTTTSLPGGVTGSAYSQSLSADGGTTPYTWSLADGSLPSGLELSPGGVITGTPKGAGTSSFTVKVTDAENPAKSATVKLSLTVAADKADVAVKMSGPASAKPGASVTDTITVTDNGPVAASKVKVTLDGAGLTAVTASAGGSTKSVTVLGVTLSTTTWSVASLAPGQAITFTISGTVPARGIKVATAAGLALASTADPDLLNNAGLVSTKITS